MPPTDIHPRSGRRRSARTTAGPVALLVSLPLLLAACGGSSNNSGSPAGASSSSSSAQTGDVAFAECVRSHGVPEFPDPQNGHFLVGGNAQSNPNFQSAVHACQHLLPGGSTNTGGSNNSQLLAFAHCMQTHGVPQFPDPAANGAIVAPQGVDQNSPQFQHAWHQCQSKLPGNLQGQQP